MSLATVTVTTADFDYIHQHLRAKPKYLNMHMREARQRNKKRVLRYLHAMYAPPGKLEIEGVISGPGVFWEYRLIRRKTSTQLSVLTERGSPRDVKRVAERFLSEIMARIVQEKAGFNGYPRRKTGEFYLKRSKPGTPASHRACVAAITGGQLDSGFVSKLATWNLALLHP